MAKILAFFLVCCISIGCSYEGKSIQSYLKDPRSIIQDPHFTSYQEKRGDLESQYLKKEIAYVDYVEQMDQLDQKYSQEVQERSSIINTQ